jgi:hypothetical protein
MNGMSASFLSMLVCFSILSSGIPLAVVAKQVNNLSLDALTEGQNINGFRPRAIAFEFLARERAAVALSEQGAVATRSDLRRLSANEIEITE